MRFAAHYVRRTHQHAHAGLVRGIGGFEAGREFCEPHPIALGFLDMVERRIVMAGDRDAARRADFSERVAVRSGVFRRGFLTAGDEMGKRLFRQAALGLVVERVLLHRLELPLPRRMVHQRDQPHIGIGLEIGKMVEHVGSGDLAAQVDQVLCPQPVLALGRLDGIGHLAHLALGETAILIRPHAQAVEHGGNAGGGHLGVMRLDRRGFVPPHARAR